MLTLLASQHNPWMLYWLVIMCSMGAATQGMDESVNNGAVAIYPKELGFANKGEIYQGVAVSAPYLACAVLGCWLNEPMNRYFGRRGTIFISCFIAAAASIWEAFTYSWGQLFGARFLLGLGIGQSHHAQLDVEFVADAKAGAKSSTIPVYTAECGKCFIR
jgi:MFS family permease